MPYTVRNELNKKIKKEKEFKEFGDPLGHLTLCVRYPSRCEANSLRR